MQRYMLTVTGAALLAAVLTIALAYWLAPAAFAGGPTPWLMALPLLALGALLLWQRRR